MPIGLGIGLNISMRGGLASGFSLDAPVATWTSAATVAQAIFGLEAPAGVVSGDQVYGEASVNSDVSSPFDTEIAAISAGDLIDLVIEDFAFAAFTDGLKYCRFCIKNAGGEQISAWSNIISRTIAVLPVLSSPTDLSTGQTTADVGVTTDTAEGTLYCVVTTSATPPTKAQVKAGQDNSGAAATYASSQAITTTGVKAFSATGLTTATAYTAHFMHEDAGANQSTVSTADGFTTASSAYTAVAVRFDGTDRLTRGAALTGASGTKVGIFSCWFRNYATTGNYTTYIEPGTTTGPGLNIYLWGGNDKIRIFGMDSGGGTALDMYSSNTYLNGMGWAHLLASWDLAAGLGYIYINDAADLSASPTLTNANIAYATPTEWNIGARNGGSLSVNADLSDFYLNTATYLDITNSTNRRKFITAGLKPVDLGSDGSTPTGSAPMIFLKNSLATWPTNVGTGGGFTLTGTLASSSSSPSD